MSDKRLPSPPPARPPGSTPKPLKEDVRKFPFKDRVPAISDTFPPPEPKRNPPAKT
jgi:hypothetical protein